MNRGSTRPGDEYGGRYQIKRSIASGGMAEVFVARDALLDRLVALKLMHPEFTGNEAFVQRFRREAQAAASLNDPRIVCVYDWGAENGTYFIVMEYVEGETLSDTIRKSGPMPIADAVRIAADVCGALHVAHQNGIVHRDVKPANISIDLYGQTKVMDFGIARAASAGAQQVTQTGTVIGTASYFSPEQAQGLPVDPRSDVYSVGVVLYEMLTGRVPFQGDSPVAVAYKHVSEDPPLPRSITRDIPPELEAVVMKALSKNPENRYQSAHDMQQDLARILRGEPVEATPLLPAGPPPRADYEERTAVYAPAGPRGATEVMHTAGRPPPGRQPGRGLAKGVAAAIFLVIVAVGVGLFVVLADTTAPNVEVPEVVGLPVEDAQRTLLARGLNYTISGREFSSSLPASYVLSQDPEEGRKVDEGESVNLVLSEGPEQVEVPDVRGVTQPEADQLLSNAGLRLGDVSRAPNNDIEPDLVIEQTPGPAQIVNRNDRVDIVLSTGPPQVGVPELVDLTEEQARAQLADAGLAAATQRSCDPGEEPNIVLSQDPAAGTPVPEGAEVSLQINSAAQVPDVEGDSELVAETKLENAGFNVLKQGDSPLDLFENGTVENQSPEGGTLACPGDTVTIEF
ncbi:MAG: Stk1 family PASTA domain-containing Ser/Thr kinase [Actinomycetota bacterium]